MLSAFFYPDRTARRPARLEGKSTASHTVRIPPVRRPRPLRRRKAQHLSRRWTFPPFCTTMIFAREDIPPPRTHAPVAQLDRVSDSDSEGHRFDSCRVYHTPAVFTAGAFFPSAGVLPMPKRNNTNQPVSDSLRRFSADTTCQYVYYCLRRLREKSSSNSSLTGGTVPRRRFLLRQGNRRG